MRWDGTDIEGKLESDRREERQEDNETDEQGDGKQRSINTE